MGRGDKAVFLCKDNKKDIFAVFADDFELSQNDASPSSI